MNGMLWELMATGGEQVAAGDAVAELVDCDRAFILAEMPQQRVTEIDLGAVAM